MDPVSAMEGGAPLIPLKLASRHVPTTPVRASRLIPRQDLFSRLLFGFLFGFLFLFFWYNHLGGLWGGLYFQRVEYRGFTVYEDARVVCFDFVA